MSALVAAPASADEPPASEICVEPQVLDELTQECVDPPETPGEQTGESGTPLECVEPQVPDEAGENCIDPPAGEGETPPALECEAPQVPDEAGESCVDPRPEPEQFLISNELLDTLVDNPKKIAFCHRTASETNPYVFLETSINAFFNSGHISHTGPIYPLTGPDDKWGDIYPPNEHDDDGQNWTEEGQAIFDNDCVMPGSDTGKPSLKIEVGACVLYQGTEVTISAIGLKEDRYYRVFLGDDEIGSGTGYAVLTFYATLPPGNYDATVKAYADSESTNARFEFTVDFLVEACPELGLEVTPDTCSLGDDGQATLYFTGLIEGESYSWLVEGDGGYSEDGEFTATGDSHSESLSDLPPDHFFAKVVWNPVLVVKGEPGEQGIQSITEPEQVKAKDWFTIDPCKPGIWVKVWECTNQEGSGSAKLWLYDLVDGVEYDVWVTAYDDKWGWSYFDYTFTADDSGKKSLTVWDLPADASYTVWVQGWLSWPTEVDAKKQYDPVKLKTHADVELAPCPDLDIEVTPEVCSLGDDGVATIELTGLEDGEDYWWEVWSDGGYYTSGGFTADGDTETVELSDLPPDHYEVYVEQTSGGGESLKKIKLPWAEDWFTIEPCEPEMEIVLKECPGPGGTGGVTIMLSNLVDGVDFDVWVTALGDKLGPTFGGVQTLTGDSGHKASVHITPLAPGGSYTVWLEGYFWWPEGNRDVTVLNLTVTEIEGGLLFEDRIDFSLKPQCPDLPSTGSDHAPGLAASLLLVGAGGLALAVRSLRRHRG